MYGTIEGANAHFIAVGFTPWTALTDEVKQVKLAVASQIIDALYGHRFPGRKTGGFAQVAAWPRADVVIGRDQVPEDLIPVAIEIATYEVARMETAAPGSSLPASFGDQQTKREKVDVLEVEYFKNMSTSPIDRLPYYPLLEGILAGLLNSLLGDFPIFWVR